MPSFAERRAKAREFLRESTSMRTRVSSANQTGGAPKPERTEDTVLDSAWTYLVTYMDEMYVCVCIGSTVLAEASEVEPTAARQRRRRQQQQLKPELQQPRPQQPQPQQPQPQQEQQHHKQQTQLQREPQQFEQQHPEQQRTAKQEQKQRRQKPGQESITDVKDRGTVLPGTLIVAYAVLLWNVLCSGTGVNAKTDAGGPGAMGSLTARLLASSWPEDGIHVLAWGIGAYIGGRTFTDCGISWSSIPGEKVTTRTSWVDGDSSNHPITRGMDALCAGAFVTDDGIGTCRDRGNHIVMRQRITEQNASYMPMWDDTVVNDHGRVINMVGSRLLVQMYFANSVELDIKIGLSKIHAKTTKSELVKVIVRGTALQLMLEGQARLMRKCSFGVAASSACHLFCVSEPWLRRSARTQQSSLTMSMTLISQ